MHRDVAGEFAIFGNWRTFAATSPDRAPFEIRILDSHSILDWSDPEAEISFKNFRRFSSNFSQFLGLSVSIRNFQPTKATSSVGDRCQGSGRAAASYGGPSDSLCFLNTNMNLIRFIDFKRLQNAYSGTFLLSRKGPN